MSVRAQIRRAFPYLVIAVVGFALAYIIILIFVLPTKIVPRKQAPYVRDTAPLIIPTDPDAFQPTPNPVTVAPYIPPAAPIPTDVPHLVGMMLPDARGVLNTLRLNIIVQYDTSSIDTPNTVLRQSPLAGTTVSAHGVVTVTVSRLPTADDTTARHQRDRLPPIQADTTDTTQE